MTTIPNISHALNAGYPTVAAEILLEQELARIKEKNINSPLELGSNTTENITFAHAAYFHSAIDAAKNDGKETDRNNGTFKTKASKWFGAYVHTYPAEDYQKMTNLFLLEDSRGGFALKNGDIVSVFKHPQKAEKGLLDTLLPKAIQMGGNRLDCFNGVLPILYSKFGFSPVAKVKFNVDYPTFRDSQHHFLELAHRF